MFEAIPTFEACDLCEVPKASLINTSPKEAQYFANFGLLVDSALLFKSSHLVFSSNTISPDFIALTTSFTSFPTASGTKITSFPSNNFVNSLAIGFNVLVALSDSSFTLPKCESKITLAPDS